MVFRLPTLFLFLVISTCVHAQSAPQNPQKDRKDYIIEVLEGQRNAAQSNLAGCLGTHNEIATQLQKQLADLTADAEKAKKQIADLTAENEKLKKPADESPAPAADRAPK